MVAAVASQPSIPTRKLGKTGVPVTIFGLGGEGVLRTTGREADAVPVIRAAVDEGVTYFDTAPAYSQSRDYLGAALGIDRKRIFLASKTHARDADGTKRLIEDSLVRLKTDHIDLMQLHDLRDEQDLDGIFSKKGALSAVLKARDDGVIRFIGITGHQNPEILLEAMRRFSFDTILTVVNPGEPVGRSFMRHVIPEARKQQMGVIGMKVLSRGRVLQVPAIGTTQRALQYAWSADIDVAIVGCSTAKEVRENVAAARGFTALSSLEMQQMEAGTRTVADRLNDFKIHRDG